MAERKNKGKVDASERSVELLAETAQQIKGKPVPVRKQFRLHIGYSTESVHLKPPAVNDGRDRRQSPRVEPNLDDDPADRE